jgi:SAM-dependent methyltransferase
MTDSRPVDPPSPFVEAWIARLAPTIPLGHRALDVATGKGRHAVVLARAGFRVFGVDRDPAALRAAVMRVRADGHRLWAWCADLTRYPLPANRFDVVVVTRYLQRDLFPSLISALAPGGVLIYETFTEAQRTRGYGPTSPDHLLNAGELRRCANGLAILHDAEIDEPDCVAQLVGRRTT